MRHVALVFLCLLAPHLADAGHFRRFRANEGGSPSPVGLSLLPTISTADECTGNAITGTKGEAVTVTRSSSGACVKTGNSLVTIASNKPRVELGGLRVEGGVTNYFLTSGTPATQAVTLAAGTYTGWIDGSGSVDLAVGTAVATSGLPCTATSSSDCTFVIGTGGTVTATITGSPTRAQVENAGFRTSYVATTGTTAARANESATITNPIKSTQWCVGASVTIRTPAPSTGTYGILSTGGAATLNSFSLYLSGSAPICFINDASDTKFQAYPSISSGSHFIQCCQGPTGPAIYVDGLPSGSAFSGTGTGISDESTKTTFYIGTRAGSSALNSTLSDVRICNSANPSKCGAPATVTRIDCIGDSITALGGSGAWPALMDAELDSSWIIFNKAVSGSKSDEMITKYRSEAKGVNTGGLVKFVTLLGGVNDIKADVDAATVYANLTTIISEAQADGARVVVSTIPPWSNYTAWTSAYQTQTETLNNLIRTGNHGATVIDAYAALGDPNDATALNPAYDSGDGLHPNDAGHQVLADLFKAAISP